MFSIVNLVDGQDHGLLRFAQEAGDLFIDRGQAFLSVDHEKQKIALAQRFLGLTAHLRAQFRFTSAEDSAGIP